MDCRVRRNLNYLNRVLLKRVEIEWLILVIAIINFVKMSRALHSPASFRPDVLSIGSCLDTLSLEHGTQNDRQFLGQPMAERVLLEKRAFPNIHLSHANYLKLSLQL